LGCLLGVRCRGEIESLKRPQAQRDYDVKPRPFRAKKAVMSREDWVRLGEVLSQAAPARFEGYQWARTIITLQGACSETLLDTLPNR
jgi:hypothetical protein